MAFNYFLMLTIVAFVIYAGYDETMKLVAYAELKVKYAIVMMQMKWMGWKLKRQLVKDTTNFKKFLKEYDNG